MQTQKAWLERNRNADIDLSLKEFRGAPLRYGKGEAFVATALEAAGFIAPAEGSENMLLSAYLGQQEAMMEGDKEGETEEKVADAENNSANAEDVKYSLQNDRINEEDVKNLQEVGRKSVNAFTSDDIQAARKWAEKYYQDIGTKSPFFRAWFGDWRAHDKKPVFIADIPRMDGKESRTSQRGNVINQDTGWEIRISNHGEQNTRAHSGEHKLSYYGLAGIRELIGNSVLLDTEVHEHHRNNPIVDLIAFDHRLYALGKNDEGNIALYRITVEEMYEGAKATNSKRFHNLKYIEKIKEIGAAEGLTTGENIPEAATFSSQTPISNYTVADLYSFVKKYDKDFNQNDIIISQSVLNDDGSPKEFYHGTPNGTFYTFKDWQYFTSNKEYADVYQEQGASSNGYKKTADNPKTYAVYLQTGKIFDTRKKKEREIFQREFYGKWGNGAPLSERGLPDWTDGDDLIEFLEENGYEYDTILLDEGGTGGYGEEVRDRGISYVIRDSSQIKSADENIGTFDKNNPDIRYSLQTPTESIPDVGEDAELSAQVATDKDAKAALQMVQKLYSMATQGKGYLGDVVGAAAIQPGAWKNRLQDVTEKLKKETGTDYSDKYIRNFLFMISLSAFLLSVIRYNSFVLFLLVFGNFLRLVIISFHNDLAE